MFGFMEDALGAEVGGSIGPTYYSDNPILNKPSGYFTARQSGNNGFVGLDNQGATCYLNSLLQALYMTHDFREGLFRLTDEELGYGDYLLAQEKAKEAARKKKEQEEALAKGRKGKPESAEEEEKRKRAEKLKELEPDIAELVGMGMEPAHVKRALLLFPKKEQRDQAFDYIWSHDFSSDSPDPLIDATSEGAQSVENESSAEKSSEAENDAGEKKPKGLLIELRNLFARLQAADQRSLGTSDLTRSFGWSEEDGQARVQHDIHELNRILMDAVSMSLKGTSQEATLMGLHTGKLVNKTLCFACGALSTREEEFGDLSVVVRGMGDLCTSLTHLVSPEKLEGRNQYRCGGCNNKVDAKRGVALRKLPPVLTLALDRFTFDLSTLSRVKVTDRFTFPDTLDMSPFLEENIDFATIPCREDGPSVANNAGGKKKKKGKDDEQQDYFQNPVSVLDNIINAAKSDQGQPPVWYKLFAVLIHQGSAYSGHYHTYIRDFSLLEQEGESRWFDFNDSHVSSIKERDLKSQEGGQRECAYMLMYRRMDGEYNPEGNPPQLPARLEAELKAFNESLIVERKEYERASNEIKFVLCRESRYVVVDNKLVELPGSQDGDGKSSGDPIDGQVQNKIDMLLDKRGTVADLVKKARTTLGLPEAEKDGEIPFVLTVLHTSMVGGIMNAELGSRLSAGCGELPLGDIEDLYSGGKLLVWDGVQVGGVPVAHKAIKPGQVFKPETEPRQAIERVECACYLSEDDSQDPVFIALDLDDNSKMTFLELCRKLKEHTGLSPHEMAVHVADTSTRKLTEVPLGDLEKTLVTSLVQNSGAFVAVQRRTFSGAVAVAADLNRSEITVQLSKALAPPPSEPGLIDQHFITYVVRASGDRALRKLIEDAVQDYKLEVPASKYRLRKMAGNKPGTVLRGMDLSPDFIVSGDAMLEVGEIPSRGLIELFIRVVCGPKVVAERLSVFVDSLATLRQVKEAAVIAAGLVDDYKVDSTSTSDGGSESTVRSPAEAAAAWSAVIGNAFSLYRCNVLHVDERGKALGREGKDDLSLGKLGVDHGDVLWLEENPSAARKSPAPSTSTATSTDKQQDWGSKKGDKPVQYREGNPNTFVQLEVFLYPLAPPLSSHTGTDKGKDKERVDSPNPTEPEGQIPNSDSKPSGQEQEQSKEKEKHENEQVGGEGSGSGPPLGGVGAFTHNRNALAVPVGEVRLSVASTLFELKDLLTHNINITLAKARVEAQSDPTATPHPLLSFVITENNNNHQIISPSHLRLRMLNKSDCLAKLLARDEETLKKLGITSDRRLGVQILPPDSPELGLSRNAFVVKAYFGRRHHTGVLMFGPIPGAEVVVDGRDYLSPETLTNTLAQAARLPAEGLCSLKWMPTKEWAPLGGIGNGMEGGNEGDVLPVRAVVSDSDGSLTAKPYALKEGDTLLLVDMKEWGMSNVAQLTSFLLQHPFPNPPGVSAEAAMRSRAAAAIRVPEVQLKINI